MQIKLQVEIGQDKEYEVLNPSENDLRQAIDILQDNEDNFFVLECLPPVNHVTVLQSHYYDCDGVDVEIILAEENDIDTTKIFENTLTADEVLAIFNNLLKGISPTLEGWELIWEIEEERKRFREIFKAAEQGDADAQFCLAFDYLNGDIVQQDYSKAIEWFKQSVLQDNPHAKLFLGSCYYYGRGVCVNHNEALKWIENAIEQCEHSTKYRLDESNYFGYKMRYDFEDVINKCILKLAESGNISAQYCMALLYKEGVWVERNRGKAIEWLTKAAESGDSKMQRYLADLLYGVGELYDEDKAIEWYTKAAEQGDLSAQCTLGRHYFYAIGKQKDYYKAFKWLALAAEQGSRSAQYHLGLCYRDGKGVEKDMKSCDYESAVKWFTKAAESGHPSAQYALAVCYRDGIGMLPDKQEAIKWFERAASQDYTKAKACLGDCYYRGEGVPQDYNEAIKWYKAAAPLNAYSRKVLKQITGINNKNY